MPGQQRGTDALHTVTAFAAREQLVLAQVKTDAMSNEITAILAVLDLLSVEGAVVTIDAMGCQPEIAHGHQQGSRSISGAEAEPVQPAR